MSSKNVVIVGGHGKVALLLARYLTSASHNVTSIIRNKGHSDDITAIGAKPLVLSLEDAPVVELTKAFEGADVVYFSAGAGGLGSPEQTMKVDYEGAVKVFDAIEGLDSAKKPRLILVSSVDARDPTKVPAHYNESDIALSDRMRPVMRTYLKAKYQADKNLAARTSFQWTILRPGGLTDGPGVGKAKLGKAHITVMISRDDVAKLLFLLLDRQDAAGLTMDMVSGDRDLETELAEFIQKGETDLPE